MSFDSFTDFVAMGGHAAYVWPAYGLGLVVLAGLVAAPMRARRRFLAVEAERARARSALETRARSALERSHDDAARRGADDHGTANASDST